MTAPWVTEKSGDYQGIDDSLILDQESAEVDPQGLPVPLKRGRCVLAL